MESINIKGIQHAYDLTAAVPHSPTLVFIHGWLLSRAYWQPLIELLSPAFQCLSYDMRGFGESLPNPDKAINFYPTPPVLNTSDLRTVITPLVSSPLPSSANYLKAQAPALPDTEKPPDIDISRYTPAAYAEDLGILLRELNISEAWLIGHSLGGTIALWGAYQLPDCVQGVVCVNAGGGIYLKEEFERFRGAGAQMLRLRPRWLTYLPLLDLLFTRAAVARPVARRWGRQRLIDFVSADPEAALGTLLDSTTEAEVHLLPQIVSKVKQPVYFVAGAKDKIMEPKYVRHLASFHYMFQGYGENVFEIPNCGHLAMLENPDTLAEHIRNLVLSGL